MLTAFPRQQWLRASLLRHTYSTYLVIVNTSPKYSQYARGSSGLLTLNIPSLARQRCLSSWGPRRTPWFFL